MKSLVSFLPLKRVLLLNVFVLSILTETLAQNKLKFNFDDSGKTYVKFSARMTAWARVTELNPGTLINSEQRDYFPDLSFRRLRFNVASQITSQLYFNLSFGGNNMNHLTTKNFVFRVLDAHADYEFNKAFAIGAGKSSWQGGSRWEIRSSKTLMGLDAPLYSLSTVDRNDDIGRLFGFYIKGQFHKLDYRFIVNQSLSPQNYTPKRESDFAYNAPRPKFSGYVKYQFLNEESNKTPYTTGTYLGKKKVLAVGTGFTYQQSAMWSNPNYGMSNSVQDTLFHNIAHWSVDVFYDAPIGLSEGMAITSYVGFHNYGFGPNYVRNVGANGMATGTIASVASFNGAGNAFPIIGTGRMIFIQFGILLPKSLLGKGYGQLQPNFSIQLADWDRLKDKMIVYDFDLNWFIKGHDNKFTLGYQLRPIFGKASLKQESYKGMFVLQYQLELN